MTENRGEGGGRREPSPGEKEARLRAALVDNASEIGAVLDAGGTVRYVGPSLESILGRDPEAQKGRDARSCVHPEDAEEVGRALGAALRGRGSRRPVGVRIRHADGSWRHFEAVAENLLDDPDIEGVLVNAWDVTERKEAEEALKEERNLLRTVIDNVPGLVFAKDTEHRFVVNNDEHLWILGAEDQEEALGNTDAEFMPEELTEGYHADDRRVFRTGEAQMGKEEPVVVPSGERRWISTTKVPLRDDEGKIEGLVAVSQDVTERKKAEDALKESEERYRALVEQAADAIFVHDLEGRLVDVNRRACESLGYSRDELLALSVADIEQNLEPGGFGGLWERVASEGPLTLEGVHRRKDGTTFPVEVRIGLFEAGRRRLMLATARDVTERKEAEEALREVGERYRTLVEGVPAVTYVTRQEPNGTSRTAYISPQVESVLGYTQEEYGTDPTFWQGLLHPDDRDRVLAEDARTGESQEPFRIEFRMVAKDGRIVWLREEGNLVRVEPDGTQLWHGVMYDVTELKQAEEALRESEERFRALVQNASDMISILNPDGTIRYISPSVERVLGYLPEERVGRDVFGDETHPDDTERTREAFARGLGRLGGVSPTLEFRVRHKNGSWRHLEAVATNRLDHPAVRGIVVNARDVTERRTHEERLEHQALHDGLTGLPNRALFLDRLSHALARRERLGDEDGGSEVAVLFLDLDNFKYVNDSLGHEVGDRLLVEAADRLKRSLRPSDTAARLGGDEFVVLLEEVEGEVEATRVAGRIIEALKPPFVLGGREAFATASVGVALGGRGTLGLDAGTLTGAADLLRRADLAMYEAKNGGKARYAVFDPESERRSLGRLELENGLRRALERDEFRVFYQPVVALDTGRLVGFEALIRWEHPERGLVYPDEFVPLAEETGLIVPVGRWVLREACRRTREWQVSLPGGWPGPPLLLEVNLSARQLSHPGLVGDVGEALAEAGLDPAFLTLEITEGAVVGDEERHVEALGRLRDLGAKLAIDDFGTGYSSLSYLRRLPAGMLKIDRSFVERIGQEDGAGGGEDEVLLSGVIGIAHGLGMRALAEGVETPEQLARLRGLGCDLAQGHLFSRPLPGEEATEFLRANAEGNRGKSGADEGSTSGPPDPPWPQ